MGTQIIVQKVSDITGEVVEDESQLTRLILTHPDYPEPITLEVLPEEVEAQLPEPQDVIAATYFAPGIPDGMQYLLTRAQIDALFAHWGRQPDEVLSTLSQQQEEERRQQEQSPRQRGTSGRRRQPRRNWASPELAGEPHPGRVSPQEAAYVRKHLEEVNQRLGREEKRLIDPADPRHQKTYGFKMEPIEDAEVIEETPPPEG